MAQIKVEGRVSAAAKDAWTWAAVEAGMSLARFLDEIGLAFNRHDPVAIELVHVLAERRRLAALEQRRRSARFREDD